MLIYCFRRLLALIPVGFGVLAFVAFMIHFVPGDPVDAILGDYATLAEKVELRAKLGLDLPVLVQFWRYLRGVFGGDLGRSLIFNRPVVDLILERMGATVELAFTSMLLAILLALPIGIYSALRRGRLGDYVAMGFALFGVAIPNFWLGPMLIFFFSVKLGWVPVSERTGLASYILPTITLGTAMTAFLSRITRSSLLENLQEDYVRTAKAKGNTPGIVIFKHVLKNSALPIVTVVGIQFGVLLTGAIVTEKIFDWPGIGSLMLEGLGNRDYPVVQACVLLFASSYLIVNLLTDVVSAFLDPRIKLGER